MWQVFQQSGNGHLQGGMNDVRRDFGQRAGRFERVLYQLAGRTLRLKRNLPREHLVQHHTERRCKVR